MRGCLAEDDRRLHDLADFIAEGGKAFGVVRRLTRLVPFLDPACRQDEMGRPSRTGEPLSDEPRRLAAFRCIEGGTFDQPVMRMERAVEEPLRNVLPSGEINQVDTARRHDLGNAGPAGAAQALLAAIDHRPGIEVADFGQREIHHRGKTATTGDVLEGHAAHAGGVEDGHLESAILERRLQTFHI